MGFEGTVYEKLKEHGFFWFPSAETSDGNRPLLLITPPPQEFGAAMTQRHAHSWEPLFWLRHNPVAGERGQFYGRVYAVNGPDRKCLAFPEPVIFPRGAHDGATLSIVPISTAPGGSEPFDIRFQAPEGNDQTQVRTHVYADNQSYATAEGFDVPVGGGADNDGPLTPEGLQALATQHITQSIKPKVAVWVSAYPYRWNATDRVLEIGPTIAFLLDAMPEEEADGQPDGPPAKGGNNVGAAGSGGQGATLVGRQHLVVRFLEARRDDPHVKGVPPKTYYGRGLGLAATISLPNGRRLAELSPGAQCPIVNRLADAVIGTDICIFHTRRWLSSNDALAKYTDYAVFGDGRFDHATRYPLLEMLEDVRVRLAHHNSERLKPSFEDDWYGSFRSAWLLLGGMDRPDTPQPSTPAKSGGQVHASELLSVYANRDPEDLNVRRFLGNLVAILRYEVEPPDEINRKDARDALRWIVREAAQNVSGIDRIGIKTRAFWLSAMDVIDFVQVPHWDRLSESEPPVFVIESRGTVKVSGTSIGLIVAAQHHRFLLHGTGQNDAPSGSPQGMIVEIVAQARKKFDVFRSEPETEPDSRDDTEDDVVGAASIPIEPAGLNPGLLLAAFRPAPSGIGGQESAGIGPKREEISQRRRLATDILPARESRESREFWMKTGATDNTPENPLHWGGVQKRASGMPGAKTDRLAEPLGAPASALFDRLVVLDDEAGAFSWWYNQGFPAEIARCAPQTESWLEDFRAAPNTPEPNVPEAKKVLADGVPDNDWTKYLEPSLHGASLGDLNGYLRARDDEGLLKINRTVNPKETAICTVVKAIKAYSDLVTSDIAALEKTAPGGRVFQLPPWKRPSEALATEWGFADRVMDAETQLCREIERGYFAYIALCEALRQDSSVIASRVLHLLEGEDWDERKINELVTRGARIGVWADTVRGSLAEPAKRLIALLVGSTPGKALNKVGQDNLTRFLRFIAMGESRVIAARDVAGGDAQFWGRIVRILEQVEPDATDAEAKAGFERVKALFEPPAASPAP